VTKVLVVHDSMVVQRMLARELSKAPNLEIVGTAVDSHVAHERVAELAPDVLLLDVEMARMDGLGFLEELMLRRPTPVVLVSALSAEGGPRVLRALALGAIDVVGRPSSQFTPPNLAGRLTSAVRIAATARLQPPIDPVVPPPPRALAPRRPEGGQVLCVGASTGGTRALRALLPRLPPDGPATVVAQHLPLELTTTLATHLDALGSLHVREARDGDRLEPGVALIAPGERLATVVRDGGGLVVRVTEAPMPHHRARVDALFESVASAVGSTAMGVLLGGEGRDGAAGLAALRAAGARTIAEDEATSVVREAPRAAIELGAAELTLPLGRIAEAVDRWLAATPDEVT
jgi:two-component system chemotaxis response regulator CheB